MALPNTVLAAFIRAQRCPMSPIRSATWGLSHHAFDNAARRRQKVLGVLIQSTVAGMSPGLTQACGLSLR
jgi:hypothetical protein